MFKISTSANFVIQLNFKSFAFNLNIAGLIMASSNKKRKEFCEMSDRYFRRISKKNCVRAVPTQRPENIVNISIPTTTTGSDQQLIEILVQNPDPSTSSNHDLLALPSVVSNTSEQDLTIEDEGSQKKQFSPQTLAEWAVTNNISHRATDHLLNLIRLHECFQNFPKSSKTLLSTPRRVNTVPMDPGYYCHFDLRSGLIQFLQSNCNFLPETFFLQIGVDGLPISKSSSLQLWPILCRIYGTHYVFCIGCYSGNSKPQSANEFLGLFQEEISSLMLTGLSYRDTIYSIKLHCFIADAPAKSFICLTKGHTGYSSCTKCITEGSYVCGRMTFPEINAPKRTDATFKMQSDENYHTGVSILLDIPHFGFVTQIPFDYMHLCCLGVVKKLIKLWISGPIKKKFDYRPTKF